MQRTVTGAGIRSITKALSVLKRLLHLFAASVIAAGLASAISSQMVIADLQGFGLNVSLSQRIAVTASDLMSLGFALLGLFLLAFLSAFGVASALQKKLGGNRTIWLSVAGLISIPASVMLLKLMMGMTLVSAARSIYGLILYSCCGLVGGYLFAYLHGKSAPRECVDV